MRFLWDHFAQPRHPAPYVHYVHESTAFEQALRSELAAGAFDLVHIDSLDLQRFLPLVRHLPMVCTHHNAESVLARSPCRARARPACCVLAPSGGPARARGIGAAAAVDVNITVSEVDTALLRELAPSAHFTSIPNGVDTEFFTPSGNGARYRLRVRGGHHVVPQSRWPRVVCR